MEKLTFLKLVEKVIQEEKKPLTQMEIWELAQQKGYDKLLSSQGKTPWQTIGAQLYVNIRDNQDSVFVRIKSKPVKFFLKKLVSEGELIDIQKVEKEKIDKPKKFNFLEKDLYPFLSYYVFYYMNVYTKKIMHEKSEKKYKYSEWLHPDIVGAYFPIQDWQEEVLNFSKEIGAYVLKVYSFELKRELGFHNLRQSFFQAVSNSSWANEGYLVAAEIDDDKEFHQELKRLSNSFGIGIIRLDLEDPDSSEMLFQARYKTEIDWETVNKLCDENPDFKEFIVRIKKDFSGNEVWKEQYEKIYEVDSLREMIKDK